jgi:hypothetical protein
VLSAEARVLNIYPVDNSQRRIPDLFEHPSLELKISAGKGISETWGIAGGVRFEREPTRLVDGRHFTEKGYTASVELRHAF